jgi:hypothetical protein
MEGTPSSPESSESHEAASTPADESTRVEVTVSESVPLPEAPFEPPVSESLPPPQAPFELPISGSLPPTAPPAPPLPPVKPSRRRKIVLRVLIGVVCGILIASGGLYLFTRPQPVILVTSDYNVGSVAAGSSTSSFHIIGQQFSGNADINFLLDGQSVPISQLVRSDKDGNFQIDLAIPAQWPVGRHTLTARDDQGYLTKAGVPVEIAKPGLEGTPGPNGAPADNASFSLDLTVSETTNGGDTYTFDKKLLILGKPDPAGGSVCSPEDMTPQVYTGTLQGSSETYTETITFTCQGTYKQGHLTYVETATSDVLVLGRGTTCSSPAPYIYGAYDGFFTSPAVSSGTYYDNYFQANCTDGSYVYRDSGTGTWTGSL